MKEFPLDNRLNAELLKKNRASRAVLHAELQNHHAAEESKDKCSEKDLDPLVTSMAQRPLGKLMQDCLDACLHLERNVTTHQMI